MQRIIGILKQLTNVQNSKFFTNTDEKMLLRDIYQI